MFNIGGQQQQTNQIGGLNQQQPSLFNQAQYQQQPQQQNNLFGGQVQQQNSLFGQPQQQQTGLFGQTQQTQQQQGGGLYQQPQQQNIFGGQQQQQTLQNQQQMNNQQQQATSFQQYLPQSYIKPNIHNVQQMVDDLKKKKEQTNKIFDEISQVQAKLNPTLSQELLVKLNLKTTELLEGTKVLAIQQRDLILRLDEYINSLGLIEKIAKDGVDALKKDNSLFKEQYQIAEQILTQTFQRQEYSSQDNRYLAYHSQNEQSGFQVPQNYEYQMVNKLNQDIIKIGEAILKLQQFQENNNYILEDVDNDDFDEIVDQHLHRKLQRIANLSHLLFLLQQKTSNIQSRVDNFRNKSFGVLYPEKNKLFNDFQSIDLAKDLLQNIVSKDLIV